MDSVRRRLKILRQFLQNNKQINEQVIDDWYHSIDDRKPIPLWNEEGKKQAVRDSIYQFVFGHIHSPATNRSKRVFLYRMSAAAVILLTACAGIYFLLRSDKSSQHPSLAWTTINVPIGKIRQVLLPDSSLVFLKSGSTLQYSSDYNNHQRLIRLTNGEAFFKVQPDPTKPFIVDAGKLQTRVLGTAFLVQNYNNRAQTQIWVEHGKVEVSDPKKVLQILTKNDRLQYDLASQTFRTDSLLWQQALEWQKGVLLLRSAGFSELAAQLYEIYGITLTTKNKNILQQQYDAKFFIRTPVNDILQILTELHGIHFSRKDDQVTFY